MTKAKFDDAITEAKRFLRIASGVQFDEIRGDDGKVRYYPAHGKRTGQVKRASMDLTRALAEMRKP